MESSERKFTLKGLDCPHCSAEIENDVSKLPGVKNASVNLIRQVLTVVIEENYNGDLYEDIKKIVRKHEPDVVVSEGVSRVKAHKHSHDEACSCGDEICKEKNNNENDNANIDSNNAEIGDNHDSSNSDATDNSDDEDEKSPKARIIRLVIGAVFFVVGLVLFKLETIPFSVTIPVLVAAYVILGCDVVLRALRNILRGKIFDENFLMALSTVGAFAIGEYPEAVAVMLFYQIGEFFQDMAVDNSRKSISKLMDIRPDSANLMKGEELVTVHPEKVRVGDIIVVKPGEKVPLDGEIIEGAASLDTCALTGESVPRTARVGDHVLSGCICQDGVLTVRVEKEFGESTASKILDLVENATSKKAPAENFISKFAHYYTPVVVVCALLLALVPGIITGNWSDWIYRGFVFLVISCPCALVISVPLTFFGGLGAASRRGVLIKGSNYLEAMNGLQNIVFDKTGTLTKGVFKVTGLKTANGESDENLLTYAAKAESFSNHPIAKSVVTEYRLKFGKAVETDGLSDYTEITGHGISVVENGKKVLVGNVKLMTSENIHFEENDAVGTKIYVAADGKFVGSIVISDEIKEDSREAIEKLHALGVKNTVMLTGDNKTIAEAVANEIGLDEYHAELLPGDKVEKLEKIMESSKDSSGKTAFVGDGINDAPVLARADIGIAMGALGSDAAIEAADVVLMTDEPSKLIDAVEIAGKTKKIVTQNIVFALGVKVLLLILGALGIAGMWLAIFGDVGVMILAVLNSMRMLKK